MNIFIYIRILAEMRRLGIVPLADLAKAMDMTSGDLAKWFGEASEVWSNSRDKYGMNIGLLDQINKVLALGDKIKAIRISECN